MPTIFLIGYMGSGKSTLGRAVANKLNFPFIDLDDFIEEQCEATIVELFNKLGEKQFREIEQKALAQVARSNAIVACGGGTPCYQNNMEMINKMGLSIWLTPDIDRIVSRLCLPSEKMKRPIIRDLSDDEITDYVKTQLHEREAHYAQARLRFNSTHLESVDEINDTATRLAQTLSTLL